MRANTPKLWDEVWISSSHDEEQYAIYKEEKSVRWQRIQNIIHKEIGNISNLRVIEIGAGAGIYSALLAREGACVTVLDYSGEALKKAAEFFKNNQINGEFINQDALDLPPIFLDKYDISMSFGLAEHFIGEERIAIIKAHFDVLKKGGVAFISVPNKYNVPYQIWKTVAQIKNSWVVGMEYPFSRYELKNICNKIRISNSSFIGDSVYRSIDFVNPLLQIQKLRQLMIRKGYYERSKIKQEKGTPLDEYLAYALVLWARK